MFLLAISIISIILIYIAFGFYRNILLHIVDNTTIRYFITIIFIITEFSFINLCFRENLNRILKYISYMFFFIILFMLISFLIGDLLSILRININKFHATLFILAFALIMAIYGYINRSFIRITNYKINTNKNVKLRIAFLSDVHIGAVGTNKKILNKIVKKINESNPDILIFGGDIVEAKVNEEIKNYCKILSNTKTKFGSYGVLGNHEFYTNRTNEIIKVLEEEANINILSDDFIQINNNVIIVGRQDKEYSYISGKDRKKINEIINQEDSNNYKIVVDHNPKYFDEAVINNFDLQLSGHTHNGQFFPFNLVVKLTYEKAYGLLKKLNSTLIVSSGVGTWGPPIKVLSKPEIVIIDLK